MKKRSLLILIVLLTFGINAQYTTLPGSPTPGVNGKTGTGTKTTTTVQVTNSGANSITNTATDGLKVSIVKQETNGTGAQGTISTANSSGANSSIIVKSMTNNSIQIDSRSSGGSKIADFLLNGLTGTVNISAENSAVNGLTSLEVSPIKILGKVENDVTTNYSTVELQDTFTRLRTITDYTTNFIGTTTDSISFYSQTSHRTSGVVKPEGFEIRSEDGDGDNSKSVLHVGKDHTALVLDVPVSQTSGALSLSTNQIGLGFTDELDAHGTELVLKKKTIEGYVYNDNGDELTKSEQTDVSFLYKVGDGSTFNTTRASDVNSISDQVSDAIDQSCTTNMTLGEYTIDVYTTDKSTQYLQDKKSFNGRVTDVDSESNENLLSTSKTITVVNSNGNQSQEILTSDYKTIDVSVGDVTTGFSMDPDGFGIGNMWFSNEGDNKTFFSLTPELAAMRWQDISGDISSNFTAGTGGAFISVDNGTNTTVAYSTPTIIGYEIEDGTSTNYQSNTTVRSKTEITTPSGFAKMTLDPQGSENGTGFFTENGSDVSSMIISPTSTVSKVVTGDYQTTISIDPTNSNLGNTFQSILDNGMDPSKTTNVVFNPENFYVAVIEDGVSNITVDHTATSITSEVITGLASSTIIQSASNVTATAETIYQYAGATSFELSNTGSLIQSPSIDLDGNVLANTIALDAGTTAKAPLKFSAGTNTTAVSNGSVEFDGTKYTASAGGVRYEVVKVLNGSASLNFPSTVTQSSSDLTLTVTGAADGDVVGLGIPSAAMSSSSCGYVAWVSAANTVTIRFNNFGLISIDPASATFNVTIKK